MLVFNLIVAGGGFEPPRRNAPDYESGPMTNFGHPAVFDYKYIDKIFILKKKARKFSGFYS